MPLKAVVDTVLPHIPPRSSVIVVSSLDADDTVEDAVQKLCAYGFDVIILSPSSIGIERTADKLDEVEYSILAMEREARISKLGSYGARVLDWDTGTPLSSIMGVTALM